MEYRIVISNNAMIEIDNALSYIESVLESPQAATLLLDDIQKTKSGNLLTLFPNACPNYKIDGVKYIHLEKHAYKFIFAIIEENKEVLVLSFIHDKQDD